MVKALDAYLNACRLENDQGCHNLGLMYANGRGVDKNLKTSARYHERACDMGLQSACVSLGLRIKVGTEAEQKRAFELFKEACEKKNLYGCGNLGDLYLQGVGTGEDKELGQQQRAKACEAGLKFFCRTLDTDKHP